MNVTDSRFSKLGRMLATPAAAKTAYAGSKKKVVVPDRFFECVRDHLALNAAHCEDPDIHAPLILAIVGGPGDGKTTMVNHALAKLGVSVTRLTGSDLSGQFEGDSTEKLHAEYLHFGQREMMHPLPVLFPEDYDQGIGRIDATQGTTANQGQLNGSIMGLADNPFKVTIRYIDETNMSRSETFDVKPSVVILTANDLTKLYGPLVRPGRTRVFEWVPTFDETCEIVSGILPSLTQDDVTALVEAYPTEPIAFFGQIPAIQGRESLSAFFSGCDPAMLMGSAEKMAGLAQKLRQRSNALTLESALDAAKILKNEQSHVANYLDGSARRKREQDDVE